MGIKRPRGGIVLAANLYRILFSLLRIVDVDADSVQPVRIVDVDGNVDETHHPLRFRSTRGELAGAGRRLWRLLAHATGAGALVFESAASLYIGLTKTQRLAIVPFNHADLAQLARARDL